MSKETVHPSGSALSPPAEDEPSPDTDAAEAPVTNGVGVGLGPSPSAETSAVDERFEWVEVSDDGARFMRIDIDYFAARAVDPLVAWREGARSVPEDVGRQLTRCSNFTGSGLALAYGFVDEAYTRLQLHDRATNNGKTRARPGINPPPYVLSTASMDTTAEAYIVEAPVKALALESNGISNAIGCGGVNAGIFERGSRELQPLIKRFVPPGRPVVVIFDAGRITNESVAAAEAAIARALLDHGCPVRVAELPLTDVEEEDQGPDDFIAKHGRDALQELIDRARPAEPEKWAQAVVAEGPAQARVLLSHPPFLAALAAGGPGAQREAAEVLKDYATKADVTAAVKEFNERLRERQKKSKAKQAAGNPGQIALQRGDHVEVAHAHLKMIGAPTVFDEDRTHVYKDGWWRTVPDAKQIAAIAGFAGAAVGSGDTPRTLSLRHDACTGALKISQALTAKPGFFAAAPRGLTFEDGFLSLEDGQLELVPHDPEHRARFVYPFPFEADAPCPLWERYLETVWLGDPDGREKAMALQEFLGACLFGAATKYKTTCLLYGDADSGKSTALDVARGLFPPGTTTAVSLHDFEQEYRRARLSGALLNLVAEMPSADLLKSEAFKAVIAGDVIEGRRIYGQPFDFSPRAGHLFAANTLPHVSDRSGAVWARWIVIAFNRTFDRTGAREDQPKAVHGLAQRILEEERPGVVAWAVRGYARLAAAGRYTRPPSTDELLAGWRKDSDPVRQWFDETVETDDEKSRMTATTLYNSFQGWCGLAGYRQPVAIVTFSRTVEMLLKERTGRPEVRQTIKGYRMFVGVRIKDPVLQADLVEPEDEGEEDPLLH